MSIEGIDVSSWNPVIDWAVAHAGGIAFALVKLTEGADYTNPLHAAQASLARKAGIAVGHYHYARPDESTPEAEAGYFLDTLGGNDAGEPVALDLEVDAPGVDLNAWALAWLAQVESALGFPPLLYTYPNYAQRTLSDGRLGRYPLWWASYNAAMAPVPSPWSSAVIWQYAGDATGVPGCANPTDRNRLTGTIDTFKALGTARPNPGFPGTRPDGTGPVINGVDWGGSNIVTVEQVSVVVKNNRGVNYERVWRDYGLEPWRIV